MQAEPSNPAVSVPESLPVDTEAGVPVNPSKRIQRFDYLRNLSYTLRPTKKPKKPRRSNKKPALCVKRQFDPKGQYKGTKVEIWSTALSDLLLEINDGVEGLDLTEEPPIAEPNLFFHSHKKLEERLQQEQTKPTRDDELINDIEVAIRFIQEDFGGTILNLEKLLNTHQQITFQLLWALFKPNTLVYHFHPLTEQHQILLAQSLEYEQTKKGSFAFIYCRIIHNDGDSLGYARQVLMIEKFSGARKVLELSAYPLEHHPDKAALHKRVVERGKKFVQMAKDQHCFHEISGPGMCEAGENDGEDEGMKYQKFTTHGRVMIDATSFRQFEPNCSYNDGVYHTLDSSDLTDDDFLICTPVVLGFCFGVKKWGGFAIDRLEDIEWSNEAFESLVLGEQQKTLIRALVEQHTKRSENFDDIVKGKGRGLVGLLCGNPGCGKTLTAEALAEFTKRPLYVLSAGELGVSPYEVEGRLDQVLELARIWNAVILLDEAEVFLQQRTATDVVRNALVSIFLRRLEYYHGILFLTTNLLEQCDAAFESRIHFTIKYPDLDVEARKKIWKTFLDRATKESERVDDPEIDKLARCPLNGRQIKNAVSSAQCIALSKNSPLSFEHVITVLTVTQGWGRILNPTTAVPVVDDLVDLLK
ncbi:hypothetical protein V5O48_007566 [Marasmius crinis-equi]|uniref:AAA+ ATPase domain-containing protein n=1 Tax=Marasmius crinis-equi TaxID=585013 RepID=A0ABR3FGF0_9AGAR